MVTNRKAPPSPSLSSDAPPTGEGSAESRRRPTINDIARLAEVSKKTVSRVINQSPSVGVETREKVEAIINEMGYEPDPQARGLAFRRSFLLGLIYDNPNPQYLVNMQQGILDALRGTDFELLVRPVDAASPSFLDDMRNFVERQKLFGVILPPPVSEDDRLPALLRRLDCPYVRIASVALDAPDRTIVTHDHLGGRAAAGHLLDHGHRRIAHICGPASFRASHERRRGFEEALAAAGLRLTAADVAEGVYTFESGLQAADRLLSRTPRPTAIFAGNDEMAAGALQAAHRRGLRVPEDVSIVGFDDFQIASRVWPPLTTVRAPTTQVGRIAAEHLTRTERETHDDADNILLTLIVRQSSGPAPRT